MTKEDILKDIDMIITKAHEAFPGNINDVPDGVLAITAFLTTIHAYGSLPNEIGLKTLDYALGFYEELIIYSGLIGTKDFKKAEHEERLLREYSKKSTEIVRVGQVLKGMGILI